MNRRHSETTTAEAGTGALPISVVIPAYQREDLVRRAVESALSQVPPPFEVVVVDDGSTDATAAVAAAAGARVVRLTVNTGEGGARNAGIEAAQQPWIALLDSDDEWLPGHLARVWGARNGYVLVSDSCLTSRSRGLHGNPGWRPRTLRTPADAVWPGNSSPPSCSLFARADALKIGGFRPLPLAADLDFWMRLLELGPGLSLSGIGCIYHEHGGNISAGKRDELRAAVDHLITASSARGWNDARLRQRLAAANLWDDARDAMRQGQHATSLRLLGKVLLSPVGSAGLARNLYWRRLIRIRGRWASVPT